MILSICPNPSIDTYAWLEDFQAGAVNRIENLKEYPGGKGVHVALAIKELSGITKLMGNWAGGSGEWLKSECRSLNIETGGITISGSNRKCLTFRSKKNSLQNTELLEPGPWFEKNHFRNFLLSIKKELGEVSMICASGSWPKNAPEDAYATLIDLANDANTPIIVDCSGNQLKNIIHKSFFGIHLNEEEALSLFNTDDLEEVLHLLSKNIQLVAITKGKDGLWLSYQGQIIHANVTIDRVISTVGSGDCLTAGIAFAANEGQNPQAIAQIGVACGAANCLYEAIGLLQKSDVTALLPKVTIETLTYES